MATLTATRGASTFPVHSGFSGQLSVAYGTYEVAANPTGGDLIVFCRLPAGATVVGGWFGGDDLDTGTEALDIDIGWAATADEVADPDGFGNLGVLTGDAITDLKPIASLWYPLQGVLLADGPKNFTAAATIQAVVNTPANATGTGTLSLVVYYTMGLTTT